MDSAVIAALITTHTAVFAVAVAYAAGRPQARAARRGPWSSSPAITSARHTPCSFAEAAKYESHLVRVYFGIIEPRLHRHCNDTLSTQDNEALVSLPQMSASAPACRWGSR